MVILTAALVFWRGGTFGVVSDAVCPYEKARVWFNRTVLVRLKALAARSSNAARCAMLEREVERLRLDADRVERLECEVERLRRTVGVSFTGNVRCLPAAVLSRGGTTALWQTMRIGKGASDGIRQGDPVVVPEGVVGRISRTAPHSSEVLLLTDSNSRIACELEVPSEGLGTVRGILYGGNARLSRPKNSDKKNDLSLLYVIEPLQLRYLDREFTPPPRTRIITSGLGGAFPRGLTVGYLLDSSMEPDGLTRRAEAVPAADLASLENVFVLTAQEAANAR